MAQKQNPINEQNPIEASQPGFIGGIKTLVNAIKYIFTNRKN